MAADPEKTDTKWELRGRQTILWVEMHPATALVLAGLAALGTFVLGLVLGVLVG